ncbi:MAG TPA: RHS repeat-associated core domain-containing protein [Verrucomicrobiota bacterium]|nr:RHS repeat-associated core domain-containing protein [Verrucomicrobiota bacterium]
MTQEFYPKSWRLKRSQVFKPNSSTSKHLDLTYTFDRVSNVKSIADGAATHSGALSSSRSGLLYDDLHRLTSVTYSATGLTKTLGYDHLGNLRTNTHLASGQTYTYGTRPHAVTAAGGKTYAYDACGNMITRGSDTLQYDEENHLTAYISGSSYVFYGYSAEGARLYKDHATVGQRTLYLGSHYEVRNGQKLCHVYAGGRRVATFEPQGGLAKTLGLPPSWDSRFERLNEWASWPFQEGRTGPSLMMGMLVGLLAVCRGMVPSSSPAGMVLRDLELHRREGSRRQRWLEVPSFGQAGITAAVIAGLLACPLTGQAEANLPTNVFCYFLTDHLGSTSLVTDRAGVEVQHFENEAFGKQSGQTSTTNYQFSNRYTGQTYDAESNLYYYGARYYDAEIGRFIQADTIVPDPGDGQSLNRYSYVNNNPYKYTDPTGHTLGIDILIIGIIVGAAIGGVTAAATGGKVGLGVLIGAVSGMFGGLGGLAGGPVGAIAGGAAGGAVGAAMAGSNVGVGALTGAISGAVGIGAGHLSGQVSGWGGALDSVDSLGEELVMLAATEAGASLTSGMGAALQGGRFMEGMKYGAIGAGIGYGGQYFLRWNNGPLADGDRNPGHHLMQYLGKLWALPNTALGLVYGGVGKLLNWGKVKVSLGHNGIQFEHSPFVPGDDDNSAGLTLGNTIHYGGRENSPAVFAGDSGPVFGPLWMHETQHTYQTQQLGPLYSLSNVVCMTIDLIFSGLSYQAHGPLNWNERGPTSWPAMPWK